MACWSAARVAGWSPRSPRRASGSRAPCAPKRCPVSSSWSRTLRGSRTPRDGLRVASRASPYALTVLSLARAFFPAGARTRRALPRLPPRGPGRGHELSRIRRVFESLQDKVYAGDWPARLLDRWPWRPRVQVLRHRLPILPAGSGRERLRLGFASDLHLGPLTPQSLLEEAFAHLREAALDVLVLGGDYVSLAVNEGVAARLAALVASVPAPIK